MSDDPILALIRDALRDVAPKRGEEFATLTLDHAIEDLALDSIATMEMIGFIEERLDIVVEEQALGRVRTLGDLADLVRKHGAPISR